MGMIITFVDLYVLKNCVKLPQLAIMGNLSMATFGPEHLKNAVASVSNQQHLFKRMEIAYRSILVDYKK
jgi:hypothetical protein